MEHVEAAAFRAPWLRALLNPGELRTTSHEKTIYGNRHHRSFLRRDGVWIFQSGYADVADRSVGRQR